MKASQITSSPPRIDESILDRDLRRVQSLAQLLDRAFAVPGTQFRVGLDGLVGLIPVVGDVLGLAPLAYYFTIAKRHGLPKRIYLQLTWNKVLDMLVGLVPLVGDVADFLHKANVKNAKLLSAALSKKRSRPL